MSETPAPTKRGALRVPPRGQALTRLQDLEAPPHKERTEAGNPLPPTANSTAVDVDRSIPANPASSIAVDTANTKPSDTAILQSGDTLTPVAIDITPAAQSAPKQAQRVKEPTVRITADLPASLHKAISIYSATTGKTIKDLVIDAIIKEYLPDYQ